MKKKIFCFLLIFINGFCLAQTKVKGKIVDAETGKVVSGVSIGIAGQSRSTVSNEQGEFVLPVRQLPTNINFSHINYNPYTVRATGDTLIVKLTLARTILGEVLINAPSATLIIKEAWRKASLNIGRNYYGKAFFRQLTTVNNNPKEIHELFYDLKWQVNRIIGWRAGEARYARTDTLNEIPIYNQSYLTFLFSGYLFKFTNAISPDSVSIGPNYDLRVEKYIQHADQDIVVISCKVKPSERRSSDVYVDATYYIGTEDANIYKIESTVYNIPFVNKGIRSKLTSVAQFTKRDLAFPVLNNIETVLEVPYRTGKKPQIIKIKSLINVYDKATASGIDDYISTTEFVIDKNEVKRKPYNPEFWLGNPVVQHTRLEGAFLALLESKLAFGTMSSKQSDVVADIKDPNFKLFFEKVYLHTDRDVYTTGEDIWFKAYLVNAQNNHLFNSSNNLYVDLIGPGAEIVSHKLVRLDKGTGKGDFYLPDSLITGNYRIRAYTNWMRNFSDNFFFEKNVYIQSNRLKDDSLNNRNQPVKESKPALTVPTPALEGMKKHIRFFPEGGALIEDVQGRVAIKVEDGFGKGYAATGEIKNAAGEIISALTCNETGMGMVTIQPLAGQNYTATVALTNGETLTAQLPQPLLTGFSLNLRTTDSLVSVLISTNAATKPTALKLVATCKGSEIYNASVAFTGLQGQVSIVTDQLSAGINSIVLYDAAGRPLCERLIYIEGHDKAGITIDTDQAKYSPKGKVTVKIKTFDQDNRPVPAKLSLAAVDAGISPVAPKDIVSYLQLQSEIRGEIENPRQYFDKTNPNRKHRLDVLLLTQGWRDFVWKRLADSVFRLTYNVEQGIDITGRVRQVNADKPLSDLNITLFAPLFDDKKLFSAKTGADGRFRIPGIEFYGYHYLNLTSRDAKGKKTGWLMVDSLSFSSPEINPQHYPNALTIPILLAADLAKRKAEREKVRLSDTVALREVKISRKRDRYKPIEPQRVLTITAEDHKYRDLAHYLPNKDPLVSYVLNGPNEILLHLKSIVIIQAKYVNGDAVKVPERRNVPMNRYYHLDMRQILRITLTKFNDWLGPGLRVDLVLKPDVMLSSQYDNAFADLTGYSQVRSFYAPKYDRPSSKTDLRTTIHWDPAITTDENGEATVTFYNANPKTIVKVEVEGISTNGLPLSGEVVYEVK